MFKLTPSGTETILYHFIQNGIDGAFPDAGLVLDKLGNLYGTTSAGGLYNLGTVFKLTPSATGTETILWNFGNRLDGVVPVCDLIFDKLGNLYGTTAGGGGYNGWGTLFKLTP